MHLMLLEKPELYYSPYLCKWEMDLRVQLSKNHRRIVYCSLHARQSHLDSTCVTTNSSHKWYRTSTNTIGCTHNRSVLELFYRCQASYIFCDCPKIRCFWATMASKTQRSYQYFRTFSTVSLELKKSTMGFHAREITVSSETPT